MGSGSVQRVRAAMVAPRWRMLPRWRGRVRLVRGRQHLLSLALAQATPNPVRLVHLQGVPAAGLQRGAMRADRLCLGFAPGPGRAALALRMEEVSAGHAAAGRVQLPIPYVGVGSWKASGICHRAPLLRSGPVPRPIPTKGDAAPGVSRRSADRRGCSCERPCFHRIRSDAGAAVDLTIDRRFVMIKTAAATDGHHRVQIGGVTACNKFTTLCNATRSERDKIMWRTSDRVVMRGSAGQQAATIRRRHRWFPTSEGD